MSRKSWTVFWLAALLLLFVFNGSLLITDSVESNYALTAKAVSYTHLTLPTTPYV